MNTICIISIGKLKTPHWLAASREYITRLQRVWQIREIALRDGHKAASPEKRMQEEGERILAALEDAFIPICLDERGKSMSSPNFAQFMENCLENKSRMPCFIIGGAYGLSNEVKSVCEHKISLGPMTFPHELAQVLLMEQLYRAYSILVGLPYHHD